MVNLSKKKDRETKTEKTERERGRLIGIYILKQTKKDFAVKHNKFTEFH